MVASVIDAFGGTHSSGEMKWTRTEWMSAAGGRVIWPESTKVINNLLVDLERFQNDLSFGIANADVWIINCGHWDAAERSVPNPQGGNQMVKGGVENYQRVWPAVLAAITRLAGRTLKSGRKPLIIWQSITTLHESHFAGIPKETREYHFDTLRRPENVEAIFRIVRDSGLYNVDGPAALMDLHALTLARPDLIRHPLAPGTTCCTAGVTDLIHYKDEVYDFGMVLALNLMREYNREE